MPAVAALPVLLVTALVTLDRAQVRRGGRSPTRAPVRFGAFALLAKVRVVSHLLLGWLDYYGVRLFKLFLGRWFYVDTLLFVDIWLWLVRARASPRLAGGSAESVPARPSRRRRVCSPRPVTRCGS